MPEKRRGRAKVWFHLIWRWGLGRSEHSSEWRDHLFGEDVGKKREKGKKGLKKSGKKVHLGWNSKGPSLTSSKAEARYIVGQPIQDAWRLWWKSKQDQARESCR